MTASTDTPTSPVRRTRSSQTGRWLAGIAAILMAVAMGLTLLTPLLTYAEGSEVRYVNQAATGDGNGTSWEHAFLTLQQALDVAAPGDEIWVAAGTYYPTHTPLGETTGRDRTFRMLDDVAIYGGFAGAEASLEDRDMDAIHTDNATILSGDLGVLDDPSDNAYHVIDNFLASPGAAPVTALTGSLLDGFIIEKGNADGETNTGSYNNVSGGGILNRYASPVLRNLIIRDNYGNTGGGVHNRGASPTLDNVLITGNIAVSGGGMYTQNIVAAGFGKNSNPVILDSVIQGNHATTNGGGIYHVSATGGPYGDSVGTLVVFGTNITGNTAGGNGGGLYWNVGSATVFRSNITGNSATGTGNAIHQQSGTVDAEENWWGTDEGPAAGMIEGTVGFAPWCVVADCAAELTVVIDGPDATATSDPDGIDCIAGDPESGCTATFEIDHLDGATFDPVAGGSVNVTLTFEIDSSDPVFWSWSPALGEEGLVTLGPALSDSGDLYTYTLTFDQEAAAIAKVLAYAEDDTNDAPTVEEYGFAGVDGVTPENLAAVNAAVGGEVEPPATIDDVQNIVIGLYKADLLALITSSELTESDYTTASWAATAALREAIDTVRTAAQAVHGDPDATVDEVMAAHDDLEAALAAVLSALVNAYTITGTITLDGGGGLPGVSVAATVGHVQTVSTNGDGEYTLTGVAHDATGIIITPTLAGYSFDPATRTVNNVTANVEEQDFEATATGIAEAAAALEDRLADLDDLALVAGHYTAHSWAAYQQAISDAEAALAADPLVLDDLQDELTALNTAHAGLVNITALQSAVAAAALLEESNYTADSWTDSGFEAALAAAEALLAAAANPLNNISQGTVNTTTGDLTSAQTGLVLLVDPGPGPGTGGGTSTPPAPPASPAQFEVIPPTSPGGEPGAQSGTSNNGRIRVDVPEGAVSQPTVFTIIDIPEVQDEVDAIPPGTFLFAGEYVGQVLAELDADGQPITEFDEPIQVTFIIAPEHLDELLEGEYVITYWNGTEWIALPTTVDLATGEVSAFTDHLTLFALLRGQVEFAGTVAPRGFSLLGLSRVGAELAALELALDREGCDVRGLWVWVDGVSRGYIFGGPPIVNRNFPIALGRGETFVAVCGAAQPQRPASPVATGPETVTVVTGDSLIRISERFGIDWQELARINSVLGPAYIIHPGQVLRLPRRTAGRGAHVMEPIQ